MRDITSNRLHVQARDTVKLSSPAPEILEILWRELDDSPLDSVASCLGLIKVAIAGRKSPVKLKRAARCVAVKDAEGQIVGLHGMAGEWFTAPRVHHVNLKRAQWSRVIQVHLDSLSAELAAEAENCAAIGLNGLQLTHAEAVASKLKATLIDCRPSRFRHVSLDGERSEEAA